MGFPSWRVHVIKRLVRVFPSAAVTPESENEMSDDTRDFHDSRDRVDRESTDRVFHKAVFVERESRDTSEFELAHDFETVERE